MEMQILLDQMGMLIQKNHVGFGVQSSWRYCTIINDEIIEKMVARKMV